MKHLFNPSRYHLSIGSHEPVLFVDSGDVIVTTSVDARGADANEEIVSDRGNPQTGPFYLNGAQLGDVLTVTFIKIQPNRKRGYCRPEIAPNVLEPGHSKFLSDEVFNFVLESELNIARIERPSGKLESLVVPIRPMVGCFGVAPDRGQSISTATSGPYGGNMDYKGFQVGVTAFLPVFVEGALFHIGDGHAWQSDGEILGTGIEISMDLEFTLGLIKDTKISWPRGYDSTYIFTLGNARPLDQALQHATSEMLKWLMQDYDLSYSDANILIGTFVEYDIGNVFDPAYTMVCKMPIAVLPISCTGSIITQSDAIFFNDPKPNG